LKLEEAVAKKARERMLAGKSDPVAMLPQGRTRDVIAVVAGVSARTLDKSRAIASKADEKTKEKLRKNETTIDKEYQKLKRIEKQPHCS